MRGALGQARVFVGIGGFRTLSPVGVHAAARPFAVACHARCHRSCCRGSCIHRGPLSECARERC
eukprot:14914077-Alexandrium_andersonii.AAC.1